MMLYREDLDRIVAIRDYISGHLSEDLGLERLSGLFFLSVSTLRRHFFFQYGTTIHDYILKERMLLAQRILTESPIPVSELAPLVGYKDRASFSRAFARYYGAGPDEILAELG